MTSKKKESTTYKHIFKYTGLLGSVQMLSVLISMVRNKCAAWLVGTIGFGLYDLYGRTLELIGNATNFGISLSAVRRL
jgi:O-antigen/teichoic acid export membrane protein